MNNGTKKCVNCGREIPASYGFCKYCGAKQPTNSEASTFQSSSVTSVSSNNNGHSFKIVNGHNRAENAVSVANQRASLAEQKASQAEQEANDISSIQRAKSREAKALKKAKIAQRKASKANSQSLKLQRKTQKVQKKADTTKYHQQLKEHKLQQQASPKYQKKQRIHKLIWTYLMPIIAFIVFVAIGGNINGTVGDLIVAGGIGIVSIIAIAMAWTTKRWYKKSSIISIAWNIIWIILALMSLAG